MRILLVSPYHGGSHAAWADGLVRHSRHDVDLLTLPDRFWKWRMHGGAATLARRFLQKPWSPDLLLATDMLDLTTFLAVTRAHTGGIPALLYMHENQLTYPLPADGDSGPMRRQGGERDRHYAFINFASMLAADRVLFNSRFHHDAWFDALPAFLRHFPEHNELGAIDTLRRKAAVMPVGIEAVSPGASGAPVPEPAGGSHEDDTGGPPADHGGADSGGAPLILWNQRWEYDKNPAGLHRALVAVAERGADFRLALCGQAFGETPTELEELQRQLGDRIVHAGFAEPSTYRRLLTDAVITLSTAEHEFFGVAVLEAMAAGAFAALPDRLAYPELLAHPSVSDTTRRRCLYGSPDELVATLLWALDDVDAAAAIGAELAANARRFDWDVVGPGYDKVFEAAATA